MQGACFSFWKGLWLFFFAITFHSTACFKLEEYQTAKAALEAGASLAPGDSRFTNLIKECDQHIAGAELPAITLDLLMISEAVLLYLLSNILINCWIGNAIFFWDGNKYLWKIIIY
jgi:hypothetical protein